MLEQGLKDPSKRTVSTVYNSECYICQDPEFALMGLPLCYPCNFCGGHVPADDTVCTDCKKDNDKLWGVSPTGEPPEEVETIEQNPAVIEPGVDVTADSAQFDKVGLARQPTPQELFGQTDDLLEFLTEDRYASY
jgi:hypothetical protein